ncbi:MAG: hypothetical protein IJ607_10315 [Bacteroidaceae bacterium]|nr:hypothetical protein [Bacteroidaceae bacterium]
MERKKIMLLVCFITCTYAMSFAQFYDSADELYFYVDDTSNPDRCFIFNFDGTRACALNQHSGTSTFIGMYGQNIGSYTDYDHFNTVRAKIKQNPNYYEDRVENLDYKMYYDSSASSSYTVYKFKRNWNQTTTTDVFEISPDRDYLYCNYGGGRNGSRKYIRVDKSFFRSGRSRNVEGGMYE